MIPNYLKRPSPTRLKPCQEKLVATCDTVPADGCCGVVPCNLCLQWETYDGIERGEATRPEGATSWTGTVGGIAFTSYWERNALNECEYVVTFGGYEVYRATCYEGASCRNPAGEVAATVGTESGTLRWSVYEPRELPLIDNPDTGCRDFFCGTCRCTCEELCIVATYQNIELTSCAGTLSLSSYACDPPEWTGTLTCVNADGVDVGESFEVSATIALSRDPETGGCLLSGSFDGDELTDVAVEDCQSLSAAWTLYNGTTIRVSCKGCSDCDRRTGCCPNLPNVIYATVSGTAVGDPPTLGDCPIIDFSGVIPMTLQYDGSTAFWASSACIPIAFDKCGSTFTTNWCAGVTCFEGDLVLTIADNPGLSSGIIFSATYDGCFGGVKSCVGATGDAGVTKCYGLSISVALSA